MFAGSNLLHRNLLTEVANASLVDKLNCFQSDFLMKNVTELFAASSSGPVGNVLACVQDVRLVCTRGQTYPPHQRYSECQIGSGRKTSQEKQCVVTVVLSGLSEDYGGAY